MTDKEHTTNNFAKDINAPSKEQANGSLKNQDKNFNENFTQDKEQIIIDGVDVSECAIYRSSHTRTLCCSGIYCKEQQFYNCYFKQLARKTQECEELKKQHNGSEKWRIKAESLNEKLDIKNTCYRKALEEIEGLVKNFCKDCDDYEDCNWDKEGCYYSLIPNLKDIINKAKGR